MKKHKTAAKVGRGRGKNVKGYVKGYSIRAMDWTLPGEIVIRFDGISAEQASSLVSRSVLITPIASKGRAGK